MLRLNIIWVRYILSARVLIKMLKLQKNGCVWLQNKDIHLRRITWP